MVGGVLYTTGGTRRAVVALDAQSGELLWVHRYPEGPRGAAAPRQLSGRGLSYWTDGRGDDRVLYVTPGYRLIALNAKTGLPIKSFGKDGVVDLKVGVVFGSGQQIDLETGEIGLHSTPTVVKDTIIVGSSMKEGMTITTHNNTKGLVRAFDVRTGKLQWTFNTIPRPGEVGNDTWLERLVGRERQHRRVDADHRGRGTGPRLSARRVAFVRLLRRQASREQPVRREPGLRRSQDRAAKVALPARAPSDLGSRHLVGADPARRHHRREARKLVAQPTKQTFLYVFDRVTGEPIWPIVETKVPPGDVPGEWYAPTQPIPSKPPAYGRPGLRIPDELIDFTPEMRAQAVENMKRYKWGGDYPYSGTLYNPPIVGNVNGLLGALNLGNASGGTNWPGAGADPETGIVYAQANMSAFTPESVAPPPPGFSDIPYQAGVVGQPFRLRVAAGTGTYADVPRQQQARSGDGARRACRGLRSRRDRSTR